MSLRWEEKRVRDVLIGRIRLWREALGNRRLTVAEVDATPSIGNGRACTASVTVSWVVDLILSHGFGLDDFGWEPNHLDLLAHMAKCPYCVALSLMENESADLDVAARTYVESALRNPALPDIWRGKLMATLEHLKGRIDRPTTEKKHAS